MPVDLPDMSMPQEHDDMHVAQQILSYIKEMEGWRIRLREFHWSTFKNSEHKLTDDFMSFMEGKEDEVAENMQGVLGMRIEVGDVVPTMPQANTLISLVQNILNSTTELKNAVSSAIPGGKMDGLTNILDDVIKECGRVAYLTRMD